jgi:hypothetical protein
VAFARSSGFSLMFDLGRILVRPALATGTFEASKRSRLKAANTATIKKYLKPGVIRDLD